MKNFRLNLKEHVTEIIIYEKKEMIPSTKEEKKMHRRQKKSYICNKTFSIDNNNKKIQYSNRSLPLYWKIQRCCS